MKTTISEFKAILKKDHADHMKSIKHEDDAMSMMEYYSNDARYYENKYGIFWNSSTEEWEYDYENENYTEDEDEEFYDE